MWRKSAAVRAPCPTVQTVMPQTRAQPVVDWNALRDLAGFRTQNGSALSFYLGLDPRVSPTAADVQTRTRALIDEARKLAEAARDRWTHEQRQSVREGLDRIEHYFRDEFDREGVHGVAVFVAPHDDLWLPLPLPAPVA